MTNDTDNSATSNQHDVANPPGRIVRIRYATPFMVALDWLMILKPGASQARLVWIVVSYLTPPMPERQLNGLTYATVTAEQRQATRRSWNRVDVFSSAVVLVLIAAAYLYFNG